MVSTLEVRSTYSPRLARAGNRGPLTITLEISGIMQGAEPLMGLTKQVQASATALGDAPPRVNAGGAEEAAADGDEPQEE
jgi:hypothetical protein